ncbi:hypothetical protein EV122DRAFT_248675 [Schizophyllum commune]
MVCLLAVALYASVEAFPQNHHHVTSRAHPLLTQRIPGDSRACSPHACIREIVAEERIPIPTHCTLPCGIDDASSPIHPILTAAQIRNLLMDDRVMVRLPHSNIWVAGIVVSVLQYFRAKIGIYPTDIGSSIAPEAGGMSDSSPLPPIIFYRPRMGLRLRLKMAVVLDQQDVEPPKRSA